jgi:protein-arginine kinase activator protein McsA
MVQRDINYVRDLQSVIRRVHGVDSQHVESIPVKETHQGRTVWEGVVEVFDLIGHPKAHRAYAWAHDGKHPKESSVAVLHLGKITSAAEAVRAALIQEYRSLESEES